MQKKFILPIIFLFTIVFGLFGTHIWIEKTITNTLKNFQNREIAPGIFLNYQNIRHDSSCHIKICHTLENVILSGKNFSLPLGTVFIALQPVPPITIHIKNSALLHLKNALQLDAVLSKHIIHINDGVLRLNRLNATFKGLIDSKNPDQTRLEVQTVYLKETLIPYLPKQMHFMANWLFKDTSQKLLIQIKNDWITLNDIPLLPYSAVPTLSLDPIITP